MLAIKGKLAKNPTGVRMDPDINQIATEVAASEFRSFSNYVELLIRKDAKKRGLLTSTKKSPKHLSSGKAKN